MEGGFPQLYIAPVNFDVMYQQHQQQQEAANSREKLQ
jgi:preprotein translocase subunit SecB